MEQKVVHKKEQLQQIQAVSIVTFLVILIAIHSSGDYAERYEVSGKIQNIDPETGEEYPGSDNFEYSYYLSKYVKTNDDRTTESHNYNTDCGSCVSQIDVAKNVERLAYGTAIMALAVAYMANDSIKH